MQEPGHGQNVASLLFVLSIDCIHGAANEDPQWLLNVVWPQGFRLLLEHQLLLVERQQVAQQKRLRLILRRLLLYIEDEEFLSVTVAMKITVGIVEDDGLPVLRRKLVVSRRREGLPECCAILECEARLAQGIAKAPPCLAARALVALIHEDQIVALECFYGHTHAAAALLLHQLRNLDDPDNVLPGRHQTALVQVEPPDG